MITAKLQHKLEILEIRYSGNTIGIDVPYYIPYKIIYGSITAQKGQTSFDTGVIFTDRISFYCRYNPTVTSKGFALQYKSKLYSIENVTNIEREATVIDCKLIV